MTKHQTNDSSCYAKSVSVSSLAIWSCLPSYYKPCVKISAFNYLILFLARKRTAKTLFGKRKFLIVQGEFGRIIDVVRTIHWP